MKLLMISVMIKFTSCSKKLVGLWDTTDHSSPKIFRVHLLRCLFSSHVPIISRGHAASTGLILGCPGPLYDSLLHGGEKILFS